MNKEVFGSLWFLAFLCLLSLVFAASNDSNLCDPSANDSEIPEQLFDISISLSSLQLSNAADLEAILVLESFGTEETPISLIFEIFNSSQERVFFLEDNVTVQTEEFYEKYFEELDLPEGEYLLRVTTIYSNNVVDKFEQNFIVSEEGITPLIWSTYSSEVYIVLIVFVIILIIVVLYLKRNFFNLSS